LGGNAERWRDIEGRGQSSRRLVTPGEGEGELKN